jgi:GT2 family glycosyltransferase
MNASAIEGYASRRPRLISVIIATYNGAAVLPEQLDALCAQQYQGPWELVIADNRSTDNTVEVVRAYQQKLPNLRLIHAAEQQGAAYAYNVGASQAAGDAFLFCDQDDIVASGWLEAHARALAEHHLVAGALEVNRLNQSSPWRRPAAPPNGSTKPLLNFLPSVITANLGVSREAFEAVGGFAADAYYCDDIDFAWRLQLKGYAIHDAPKAIVHYRYRTSFRDLWKQTVSYGMAQAYLYKRFAPYGMPRSSFRQAIQGYGWLIRQAPALLRSRQDQRVRWVRRLAGSLGRIKGSWRFRTFYP